MSKLAQRRILVVDDEPSIVDAVSTSLRYEGFDVEEATTGRAALAVAQERTPDLVVLDVMLPDLDGLEVTRRLRADGIRVPILFLTAKDTLEDKLAGLTIGGDDYVTKPFSLAEIIARIRVILRRSGVEGEEQDGLLRFADLEMDEATHEVRRAGVFIQLTATEFNLLRYFMLNPRRVLSKPQSSTTSGTTTSTASRTSSRPTSATCARRSNAWALRSSTPSVWSATRCASPRRSTRCRSGSAWLSPCLRLPSSRWSPLTSLPTRRCGPSFTDRLTKRWLHRSRRPARTPSSQAAARSLPRSLEAMRARAL